MLWVEHRDGLPAATQGDVPVPIARKPLTGDIRDVAIAIDKVRERAEKDAFRAGGENLESRADAGVGDDHHHQNDGFRAEEKNTLAKAKQINIRLTAEQERLLRQHCVRARVSLRDVVVEALRKEISGF